VVCRTCVGYIVDVDYIGRSATTLVHEVHPTLWYHQLDGINVTGGADAHVGCIYEARNVLVEGECFYNVGKRNVQDLKFAVVSTSVHSNPGKIVEIRPNTVAVSVHFKGNDVLVVSDALVVNFSSNQVFSRRNTAEAKE
jgi:hypothetical protein